MHVDQLRIGAFRGISNLDLELAPVTLICGDTGIGKTSVLEALGLSLRPTDPGQWVSAAMRRDSSPGIVVDGIISMFSLSQVNGQPTAIQLGTESAGVKRRIRATAAATPNDAQRGISLTIDVDDTKSILQFPSMELQLHVSSIAGSVTVHTLGAATYAKMYTDNVRWLFRQQAAYTACVQRILHCVDGTIQDIRLQGTSVQLLQRGRWVDLMMVGDGVRRALALALTTVRASRGVLLIDGLESCIHHRLLTRLTQTLINIAETLEIQLVIVTDDLVVIDGSITAVEEAGASVAVNLHWLHRQEGVVRARTLDYEQLTARREGGMDVR